MIYEFEAPPKDPDAKLRHGHDLTAWLQEGEAITGTPLVFADMDGLVISDIAHEAGIVSYSVAGGFAGTNYTLTCRVTTSRNGVNPYRIDDRSVHYRVRER